MNVSFLNPIFNISRRTLSLFSHPTYNSLFKRFFPGGGTNKVFINPQIISQGLKNLLNISSPNTCRALVAINTVRNSSLINSRLRFMENCYRKQLKRHAILAEEYKIILYVDSNGVVCHDMFQLHDTIGGGATLNDVKSDALINGIQNKLKAKNDTDVLAKNIDIPHYNKQVIYEQERDIIISNSMKFVQKYGMMVFFQSEHGNNLLAFISRSRPNGVLISSDESQLFRQIQLFYESHKVQDNFNDNLNNEYQHLKTCYTPEDFVEEKTRLQEDIVKLTDLAIKKEMLIKLALQSPILVKEEGILKLTQKAYELIRTNSKLLGVKTIDERPDKAEILKLIQEKKWDVLAATDQIPKGDIISTGPLLHKIVVVTSNSGKKLIIALFTSAQDDNVIKLANTQETNPDPEEQKKRQNFRVLQSFILAESNEPAIMPLRNLDPETTRFSKGINKEGEDVTELILDHFRKTADVWSNNDIQKYFNITLETLHKLILLGYQDSLTNIKNQEEAFKRKLAELAKTKPDGDLKYIEKMKKRKIDAAKALEEDKKLKQTPIDMTLMKKITKILKRLQQEEAIFIAKESARKAIDEAIVQKKTTEEKNKLQNPQPLTAREKLLAYKKDKELEKLQQQDQNDKKDN